MPDVNGITVTKSQKAVYDVLKETGALADHVLVPIAQHKMTEHQSSSGIRSRRAELTKLGLVAHYADTRTGSGRTAAMYVAL